MRSGGGKNTVKNNMIFNNSLDGIYVSTDSNSITGNTLKDNKANGIWLTTNADSNTVTNNIICNNVLSAIKNDGTGNTISPNTLSCTCACDAWTNGVCGGSCTSDYRQQTRTCTPTGCSPSDGLGTSRCVADSTCVVTLDLVGYWKFDENTGTKTYDSSSFKNDAILYNNPLWVTGKFGSALQFSGSNYVEVPDSSSLDLSSQVTITAWINPSSIGSYNRIVAKSYTSNTLPYTMYGLLFDNANHLRLEVATSGTQNEVNGVTTIPTNVWTFVAGTYDGSTMKIYVNGNLDNSYSHSGLIDIDNMPLSIGRSGFGSNYFTGKIDEIKIWNRALTADEIKKEYGVNKCSDGTAYGSCSNTNRPSWCDTSGNLIPNQCGATRHNCSCQTGQICQADGYCLQSSTTTTTTTFTTTTTATTTTTTTTTTSTTTTTTTIPMNPTGYWKFDEGSGSTAFDSSGNDNDGLVKASGMNQISNPSFELDKQNWETGIGDWQIVTDIKYHGSKSSRFQDLTGDADDERSDVVYIPVNSGQKITVSLFSKGENILQGTETWYKAYLIGRWMDSNNQVIDGYYSDMQIGNGIGTWDWKRSSKTYTAPSNAVYYRFSVGLRGNSKGTLWVDAVQVEYGDMLTDFKDSAWVSGKSGKALEFDGLDDYVEIPHSNSISGFTKALTASFWMKPGDTTRQTILNKYNNADGQRGWFIDGPSYSGIDLGFYASQDGLSYVEWHANYAPVMGTWYHITVIWKSGEITKFYVNGAPVTTSGTATISQIYNNVGVPLYIGKSQYTSGREFKGILDEVKVWDRALSANEIMNEYQKNMPLGILDETRQFFQNLWGKFIQF